MAHKIGTLTISLEDETKLNVETFWLVFIKMGHSRPHFSLLMSFQNS